MTRTCLGGEILEAVLLRDNKVVIPTLVLSDSDVPLPGGGGISGVHVYRDGHTGWTDRHPHVLPSVVATDDWGGRESRSSN